MPRARKVSQLKAKKTPRVRKSFPASVATLSAPVNVTATQVNGEYADLPRARPKKLSKTKSPGTKYPAFTEATVADTSAFADTGHSINVVADTFAGVRTSTACSAPARLPVGESTILVHEDHFDSWTETVELYAISRFGAAFNVSRACGVGRLIELSIFASADPETPEVTEHTMPVVCLVQQCSEYDQEGKTAYHVGVVFVGRSFPESYNKNPTQCYRVAGTRSDGLFRIHETTAPHKPRRHPRFRIKFEVKLILINKADRTIVRASGVTNDVGALGISVISTLDANIGDKIKVGCREIDFFGVAIVRNRRSMFGFERLLQMEFVDTKFPISRLLSVPEGVLEGFTK